DHLRNRCEDIGKKAAKLIELAAKASLAADFVVELAATNQAGLVAKEQWRLGKKAAQIVQRETAAGCDFAGGNTVIEINENFSKIEDNPTVSLSLCFLRNLLFQKIRVFRVIRGSPLLPARGLSQAACRLASGAISRSILR